MDAAASSESSSPSTDVQQHYSSDATDKSASERAENQESEAQSHHHHQTRAGRRRTGDVEDQKEISHEEEEVLAGRDQGQDHNQRASFSGLLLGKQVVRGLEEAGYLHPSPIQVKAIPLGRCGLGLYSFHPFDPFLEQDAIAFVQMY